MLRLRRLAATDERVSSWLPPERDITTLRKYAEDFIESALERVEGVSNSNVIGGREEELQVVIDPAKLATRGLTINDVRLALRAQNEDTSGGDFWEGKRRYIVRTLGQFRSPEQVENAILARRVFLRSARSTVIIFMHILISTIGAFLVMAVMGRSLNVPALGGLAFAVGMLVDNAIVMLENIFRRHQLGESPEVASVKGAGEVWGALLNATLANLAVFIPV